MTSALVSSIHMPLRLRITFKRTLSHGSENGGNSYRRVGSWMFSNPATRNIMPRMHRGEGLLLPLGRDSGGVDVVGQRLRTAQLIVAAGADNLRPPEPSSQQHGDRRHEQRAHDQG